MDCHESILQKTCAVTDTMSVGEDDQGTSRVLELAVWLYHIGRLTTQERILGQRLTSRLND